MLLRRFAAGLGGASGLLHLLMVGHGPLVLSLAMALAAVTCLPCAGHLWRHGTVRTWALVGLMSTLMVLLHVAMMILGAFETTGSPGALSPASGGDHTGHLHPVLPIGLPVHELFYAAAIIAAVEVLVCTIGLKRGLTERVATSSVTRHGEESVACPNEWTEKSAARRLSAPT
ncbi:hypothetical protein [Nesterenkonia haasae]|uniref:hypothetical protein n=1 Tax=Nesterenkonia haasae TaxID=2587813 RepID=UPI0013914EB0|nr:hypothetical protein [Nesterenkonia haasae]NDK32061.1 hypothetical protein [Nesterenkonia haasae]